MPNILKIVYFISRFLILKHFSILLPLTAYRYVLCTDSGRYIRDFENFRSVASVCSIASKGGVEFPLRSSTFVFVKSRQFVACLHKIIVGYNHAIM